MLLACAADERRRFLMLLLALFLVALLVAVWPLALAGALWAAAALTAHPSAFGRSAGTTLLGALRVISGSALGAAVTPGIAQVTSPRGR